MRDSQQDLPPSVHPYNEPVSMTIHVARGQGLDYALKNFPGVRVEYITPTSSEVAREGDPVHDPYADLDFRAGDRYISAMGDVWLCDEVGQVHPEGWRTPDCTWTGGDMREQEATSRSWWPLRKIA